MYYVGININFKLYENLFVYIMGIVFRFIVKYLEIRIIYFSVLVYVKIYIKMDH